MTKQTSYVETRRRPPLDWNEFLARPSIAEEEWNNASRLSASWVTCACGHQCAMLPRNAEGEPSDRRLSELGMNFYEAISDHSVLDAREVLTEIEQRSAYLLTLPNYTV